MSVDGGVTRRSGERLSVPVGDVLAGLGVSVAFGQAKVNQIDDASFISKPHKEIVRLHISVDEVVVMHGFEARNHLICYHAHTFQCQLASAVLEQVFQAVSEQLHDQRAVISFDSEPVHFWDACAALQHFVQFRFILELRHGRFQRFLLWIG